MCWKIDALDCQLRHTVGAKKVPVLTSVKLYSTDIAYQLVSFIYLNVLVFIMYNLYVFMYVHLIFVFLRTCSFLSRFHISCITFSMYIEYIIVATNYYLINTSLSTLALAIRLRRWLKMTPAFETIAQLGKNCKVLTTIVQPQ